MSLGSHGEEFGKLFLIKRGYRIIKQNYTTPLGEIDIIARDGDTIVFVEVKTRESGRFGRPFEAVDRRKQRKIANVALLYLKRFREKIPPCRFDVLSISIADVAGGMSAELIKDAFEAP